MCKPVTILSFLLLLRIVAFSQIDNYRFTNFSLKDGLADKFIYTTAQDKAGFIWVGTGTGLYRYDGKTFKRFKNENDDIGKSSTNLTRAIFCEKDQNKMWVAGVNFFYWYYPTKNKFYLPNYKKKGMELLANSLITLFYRDKQGKVWIGTEKNGLFLYNEKDSTAKNVTFSTQLNASENFITGIVEDNNNNLWVTTVYGIYSVDKNTSSFKQYLFKSNIVYDNFFSQPIVDEKENCLWVPSRGKIVLKFNLHNYTFESFNISLNKKLMYEPVAIDNKSADELWVGSWNFGIFNKRTKQLTKFEENFKSEYGFHNNKVVNLFNDKENNTWVSSFRGLSMICWQNQQIENIPVTDEDKSNNVNEIINAVSVNNSDDFLFTTTFGSGVFLYNAAQKKITVPYKNPYWKTTEYEKLQVYSIAKDVDGTIYGSTPSSLIKLNSNGTYNFLSIKDQYGKAIKPGWRLLYKDPNQFICMGDNHNFYYVNVKSLQATHYNFSQINATLAQSATNSIWPSLVDSKGNVWFTHMQGVYCHDLSKNKFFHYAANNSNNKLSIPLSNEIREDTNHHYWITTKSNGLYELYFDSNGKEQLINYTTASNIGLSSESLVRIVKDSNGLMWIGSVNSLMKFNPYTKKIETVLTKQQGMFYDNVDVPLDIISNNRLVVGNFSGLNILDINSFKINTNAPEVKVTSLKVFDTEYIYNFESDSSIQLKLSYDKNYISIELAALNYNNAGQNKFAYKIEGKNNEWIYLNDKNSITFSQLSSGSYTLFIKAANNDGLWGKQKIIHFEISAPFYKQWWFITLSILSILSLLYAWNRHKITQAQKQEKLKASFQQQIAETEMKALRAQMNPHFIFNSLNSIQKYILKNEHFEASQYLTKFSRLIRLILDHSNQNTILLSSELDMLKLYIEMESLRFDNSFTYSINVDENINTETVLIPSMLVQPYVENAIWHGLLHKEDRGHLVLNFSLSDTNTLKVVIEDNGIGREKAKELKSKQVLKKKSYGMQITENRIAIINKTMNINATLDIVDLKDNVGNATGTKVILKIPLQSLTPNM
jgi:ligand-binding sensor domain-containing protein